MTTGNLVAEWYLSSFDRWEKGMNGSSESEVHALRRRALKEFSELGFPTTRQEEWRFTNIAPIAGTAFEPVLTSDAGAVRRADVERLMLPGLNGIRLVFVNGHFAREHSSMLALPKGVRVESMAAALSSDSRLVLRHLTAQSAGDQSGFTALNTAFIQDGAFVFLPDGAKLAEPVHLLFIATAGAGPRVQSPRNLIVTGRDCRLSIVETYHTIGDAAYLTNAVSEVVVGEGTVIEHDKLQDESREAYHVGTAYITQYGHSTVTSNTITFGGSIVRNTVRTNLGGEGSECTLNGLSVATGTQLIDNHTVIDHARPNCSSHELYKSILDGRSRGVFNGKIFVRKDAQKTDAKQTNKTLLLSDEATIDTKPQLEIFADDVKCTHGATVGQLDDEQVFYLRTRGIPLEIARDILTFAFASDVVNRLHVEPLREQLDAMLHARLRRGRVTENA